MEYRLHNVSKFLNVKRLYLNLFYHPKSDVPVVIDKQFRRQFRHPVDVEWMMTGNDYEALFYENKQERIARFDQAGNLLELRTNISPLDALAIKNDEVREMGTLMNYIQIKRGGLTTHELIIRRPDKTRLLILLDDRYEIIRMEPL